MNLHRLLLQRQAAGEPIRVGLIGCGKFATMFLAQARLTPGLHVQAVADLDPGRARANMLAAGWPAERLGAESAADAVRTGATWLTEDVGAVIGAEGVDVVVEATGDPLVGAVHAARSIDAGHNVVMVNVEADVLCGPALAARAARAGTVYSLAYGDQPALIAELVDWARTVGLDVVAAGKGTKYLPSYHYSTPDTVWEHYGLTAEQARAAGMNAKMFNSFLDGTKSAIEAAAVANATGLGVQEKGLGFPPCGTRRLPHLLRPEGEGGRLERAGVVEIVSSLERDGGPVEDDLRWGVYVTFAAPSDYTARCFAEYGLVTDPEGRTSALWRPYHLIGLELGVSVASAALRREPTGAPRGWVGDVAAAAKRDLAPGEVLDGEGGFCVYGRLLPAARARAVGALPLGFSKGAILARPVAKDAVLTMADVTLDVPAEVQALRNETLAMLAR
ncbi:MAG TPA: SAF domain-containing protein [Geminicoccaceae bacterium]|nr:SAF domain-containing protein [Geminicoccaceae bacterium]